LSKLPGPPNGTFSGSAVGVMKTRSPLAVIVAIFAPLAVTIWSEIDHVENAMIANWFSLEKDDRIHPMNADSDYRALKKRGEPHDRGAVR